MVNKKKKIKSIKSYEERIREHEEKIKSYSGGNDFILGYWEKEIEEFKRKKREKEDGL